MQKTKKGLFTNKKLGLAAILVLLVASIAAVFSPEVRNILTYRKNLKAAGTVPAHQKLVEPNGDGTYKISLNVTGDAEKKAQKANVIVVFDSSSSMNTSTGNTETTYTPTTANSGTQYGEVNGEYVELRREQVNYIPVEGTPSDGSTTYYGYYNNNYVRLYYNNGTYYRTRSGNGWTGYRYSNPYTGTFYLNQTVYHYYLPNGDEYTGTRYTRQTGNQSRLEAAEDATNDLARALLSNNGKDGNANDTIQIALVDFNNTASIVQTPTTSYETFAAVVNSRDAGDNDQGTNWEDGLRKAMNVNFGDSDPTYVIFVSDGNPTFYMQDPNNTQRGGSGQENSGNITTSYNQAVPAAKSIVSDKKWNFYTIFIYGNTTGANNMTSLTTEAGAPASNNYTAANTAALQQAFAEILEKIEMSGIGTAQIEDGTTENVSTSTGSMNMLTVAPVSTFEYTITFPITDGKVMINTNQATIEGNTIKWGDNKSLTGTVDTKKNIFIYKWTEANDLYDFAPPAATNTNSEVKWDLSKCGVLVNDATYTVSFDVWPSQETYDLIADLQNGAKTYSELDDNIKKYLSEDYVLKTNTGASLTYTDTRVPSTTTVDYEDPGNAPLETSQITVEKIWIDGATTIDDPKDEEGKPFELTMKLIRDDTVTNNEITVSKALNNWKAKKYIATGLMRTHATDANSGTLEVLDTGHDYRLQEPAAISYHWELTVETTHPMIIDGTLTTLIEVKGNDIPATVTSAENNTYLTVEGKQYFKFNNKVYKIKDNSNAELSAYNNRKSYLEFKKMVTGDAPKGKEFNFSFTINNVINKALETKDDIWFSVYDTIKGETVMGLETNATKEIKEGKETGYYSAPNKTTITVKLKHGWNLRVINLGTTSTYTINEVGIATENTTAALDASDPQYFMIKNIAVTTTLPDEEAAEYNPTIGDTSVSGTITKVNTGYSVVFTNDYPGTYLTVNKEWVGEKQDSVEVELYQTIDGVESNVKDANGNNVTTTLSEENEWTHTFEGLSLRTKEDNPKPITYSVKEVAVEGYNTTYTQDSNDSHIWTITNRELTESTIVKVWDDANNQDGKRPENITMTLSDGKTVTLTAADATTNEGNNWTQTVTGLEKYDANGNEIDYTWEETLNDSNYTQTSKVKSGTTTTITNKHEPVLINLEVVKSWTDNNNQDGKRPTQITVHLLANGTEVDSATITEVNKEWKHIFTNKPKYANGSLITYTVTEDTVAEYDPTYEGLTITNTHTIAKTSICVKKEWVDNDDQDGYRPDTVIINVLANTNDGSRVVATKTLNGVDDDWTHTFENLDVYDKGLPIEYTIEEANVDKHYVAKVEGSVEDGYTVTNTHETDKTQITVEKVWDDADNQDGIRKDVVVTLVADEKVTDKTVTLSESNGYKATFEGLEKYRDHGKEIIYTVDELEKDIPTGYIKTSIEGSMSEGFKITNTHEPEKTEVSGEKVWDNTANTYGFDTPQSITVILKVGSDEVARQDVTADEEGNWKYSFTNLDKYKDGEEITYTVDEVAVKDYDTHIDQKTRVITNKYNPEFAKLEGTKTWVDEDNQDGLRPTSITIDVVGKVGTKEVHREKREISGDVESDKWTYTIEDLPKYANGEEITWTAEEYTVDGYEKTETALDIINTHSPEKVSYTVYKEWDDNDNQDGKRPTSITIRLYDDLGNEVQSLELNEENEWTDTFTDLPKYREKGTPIVYSIKEDKVKDYEEPEIEVLDDYSSKVTNQHIIETINIHIVKNWNDKDNKYGLRPAYILVDIYANENLLDTIKISEEDNWEALVEGLDKYSEGEEIIYSVREQPVENYIVSYNNFNIYNELNKEVEIIPPDTAINSDGKNIGIIYFIAAIIAMLSTIFKKVKVYE